MLYKRRRCKNQCFGGNSIQPFLVVFLTLISATSNSVVEGFGTPAFSASGHLLNNMGFAAKKELKSVEGTATRQRSVARKAASFTTSTSFIAGDGSSRRIRRSTSTRLNNNPDSNVGDSDGPSSPYWFAKVKSSTTEASQALPIEDIPKEIAQPQQPQQDTHITQPQQQQQQDTPIPPPPPQQHQPQPQPQPQPQDQLIRPSSPFGRSQVPDSSWTDIATPRTTTPMPPVQQPQQPQQQSIRPNSPFRHSQAADSSWTDIATPRTTAPIPPAQQPQQPQQRSIRPNSPFSHSSKAVDSSWTDVATPITTTSKTTTSRQAATGSGFMPIFGAVPELATPAPPQNTIRTSKEKPTKPRGASDQERDMSTVNFQTEPPASTPSFPAESPPLQVVSATDDFRQGSVPSTIKVQEIDEDDGDYGDTSVPPIILEYMSNDEYMQTIVFPFRVDPNLRPEEQIGRENDALMFTPSVKADIYKVLRSPNDPKAGAQAPSRAGDKKTKTTTSPFATMILAKLDEGTYAFCDRSLYDSMEQDKTSDSSAAWDKLEQYTPLNDDQILKAVACIGQTSPNALAITKAFEAYLSQKAWAWGDYQASAFSVEFLVAFGNELSTRLDINHRIRSQKLTQEELLILSKPPFCNCVQPETMRIFQNQWKEKKPQK